MKKLKETETEQVVYTRAYLTPGVYSQATLETSCSHGSGLPVALVPVKAYRHPDGM